jgi:hypothetical protein
VFDLLNTDAQDRRKEERRLCCEIVRIGAGSGTDLNVTVVALKYSASKERQIRSVFCGFESD